VIDGCVTALSICKLHFLFCPCVCKVYFCEKTTLTQTRGFDSSNHLQQGVVGVFCGFPPGQAGYLICEPQSKTHEFLETCNLQNICQYRPTQTFFLSRCCDICMKCISFLKLVDLLRDNIAVHQEMASIRGGEVSPELCVYLTIRYLSGGHYCDNIRFLGISPATFYYCLQKTTFYYCLQKTSMAIVHNQSLQIVFPTSEDQCQVLAKEYKIFHTKKPSLTVLVVLTATYWVSMYPPNSRQGMYVLTLTAITKSMVLMSRHVVIVIVYLHTLNYRHRGQ
jgi:hypothetical protein